MRRTDRQMDLTWAQALLAQGLTDTDIAVRLYLSEDTVRNYTSAIFSKLVVSDCTQAAVAALRYGLVDPEE